ncbi:MAG: 50S ribosomal protein L21 [Candidatus Omnitrophica bacterium]|nr:50S ribosomal protein L21 [Candidatus Omnitrophota bacterium]
MYAIVETGSKQYKVQKGDVIEVERIAAKPGEAVELDKVLLCTKGKSVDIGRPYLKGAKVVCDVVSNFRADKVIAFKYRRRKNSKSKKGHRQELTRLKVKEIQISE